jgi:hypothetical protein
VETDVPVEVRGLPRDPRARQVRGRGADHQPVGGEPAGHEARVGEAADAEHHVEPAFHHVHHPVIGRQVDLHLGVDLEERGHRACKVQLGEGGGGVQPERAAHRPGGEPRHLLCRIGRGDQRPRVLVNLHSLVGE